MVTESTVAYHPEISNKIINFLRYDMCCGDSFNSKNQNIHIIQTAQIYYNVTSIIYTKAIT